MPEAFLCADAILRIARNVCAGLRVNEKIIGRSVQEYLPFIATENLLMEGVKRGGDRQQLHEIIRRCSMEAAEKLKNGEESDLLSRLAAQPEFGVSDSELRALLNPAAFVGRAPRQVETFLKRYHTVWDGAERDPVLLTL